MATVHSGVVHRTRREKRLLGKPGGRGVRTRALGRLLTLVALTVMVCATEGDAQTPDIGTGSERGTPVPLTFRWGPQRPDLIRFNRVEALSIGMRMQARPGTPAGPLSITAIARLGMSDVEPNVTIDVVSETLRRRVTVSVFHELTSLDPGARHLGLVNSVMALAAGRDDGDYYYRTGASVDWTPPSAERRSFHVGAFVESHRDADVEHRLSLPRAFDGAWRFRPNVAARRGWDVGLLAALSPWWGTDPRRLRGGLDVEVRAATGESEYTRTLVGATLITPGTSAATITLSVSAGATGGEPPVQRLFHVGGARTLRGYAPRTMSGTSFGRAGVEVMRTFAFGGVVLFSDAAWAGDRGSWTQADALLSVGGGLALVDGLIRVDLARGMRAPEGYRVDVYLDSLR